MVGLKCFRPYPLDEVREALGHARRVVVLEKAFAVGAGGIVGQNVRLALMFLDLNIERVERELRPSAGTQRPGPHAENILREIGVVAAGPV